MADAFFYLIFIVMGNLLNSFEITNLDLENSAPSGFNVLDTITSYGSLTTGTPTTKSNPGGPINFLQKYLPKNTYLDNNPIRNKKSKQTQFQSTNLDLEESKVDGGIPYKQDKDPTVYSKYTTGTPTTKANPGSFNKFNQVYNPSNAYLDNNPIKGEGRLKSTTANTNLDVENPTPNGGIPYNQQNDPTVYPVTSHKKSSAGGFYPVQGQAASKYDQVYNPKNTYLDFIKKYT